MTEKSPDYFFIFKLISLPINLYLNLFFPKLKLISLVIIIKKMFQFLLHNHFQHFLIFIFPCCIVPILIIIKNKIKIAIPFTESKKLQSLSQNHDQLIGYSHRFVPSCFESSPTNSSHKIIPNPFHQNSKL